MCDEWLAPHAFQAFFNWAMKNGYSDNLTLDRINPKEGYSPQNCQWITKSENSRKNRIGTKRVSHSPSERKAQIGITISATARRKLELIRADTGESLSAIIERLIVGG